MCKAETSKKKVLDSSSCTKMISSSFFYFLDSKLFFWQQEFIFDSRLVNLSPTARRASLQIRQIYFDANLTLEPRLQAINHNKKKPSWFAKEFQLKIESSIEKSIFDLPYFLNFVFFFLPSARSFETSLLVWYVSLSFQRQSNCSKWAHAQWRLMLVSSCRW